MIPPMDPQLRIALNHADAAILPGQTITGSARWSNVAKIKSAAVRLFHTTSGIGTPDTVVVAEVPFVNPLADDQRSFSFSLPPSPPSFSGKLITLTWGVELVIHPGGLGRAIEFTVGPEGREIRLPRVDTATAAKKWWKPNR